MDSMFEYCRQNKNQGYICGVPDARNNEGFDFAFLKLNNRLFDLVTIDVTSGPIETKLAKKTTNMKSFKSVQQVKLYEFFQSAIKDDATFNKIVNVVKYANLKNNKFGSADLV
jgi:hypothetical protein